MTELLSFIIRIILFKSFAKTKLVFNVLVF